MVEVVNVSLIGDEINYDRKKFYSTSVGWQFVVIVARGLYYKAFKAVIDAIS
jgi:hypothetical protein